MTTATAKLALHASFAGSDTTAIVKALQRAGWYPDGKPPRLEVDHKDLDGELSIDEALARATSDLMCYFKKPDRTLRVTPGQRVEIEGIEVAIAMPAVLEVLASVPFELAVLASRLVTTWVYPDAGEPYRPPAIPGHVLPGWGAAFRGAGHDWLVSRHWLEAGPWKLWRGPSDTSLLQFHALDADAVTARVQAESGHAELRAGYVQKDFVFRCELKGLFDPASKTMKVVVHGRAIPDEELLEWAATRRDGRPGTEPFAKVAYVFMQEAEARANLARIWRYGHEVWTIRDGAEVRLDADYAPPDETPAWAR